MSEEYRPQATNNKRPTVTNNVVRESWIVVSPSNMPSEHNHRPSLENGSIQLITPPAHPPSTEEYRPPPPLIDLNPRASSTGHIPHGAGPPATVTAINPNYKLIHDQTRNSSHGTRDRSYEPTNIHVPPTPREAIGHLDGAQVPAKDDRESLGLRKWNRGSSVLSIFSSHEVRGPVEDAESIHSHHAPEKERHVLRGFFGTSREKEREKEKEREREREKERERDRQRPVDNNDHTLWGVSRLIGWTTSTNVEDWSIVMEVCDKVNQSDVEAKEASKALRKDIQFGRPAVQLSAARLWAIMMCNCPAYFIAHTTSRKFLGKIEEIALSPTTSPVVRDRLVEVVGTSVYQLRDSKHLKPYLSTWKKLRIQLKLTHPVDGIELNPDDPILNPTPHRPPSSLRQYPPNEHVLSEVTPGVTTITQSIVDMEVDPMKEKIEMREDEQERRRDRGHRAEVTYGVISPEEDMRRLFEECDIAHDNCRILAEALVYAVPERVVADSLIQEFRQKCVKSQEIIAAQIDWATAAADRARAEQVSLVGPGEIPPTVTEEQLLQALVTANSELNDVFKTYDDLERMAISEREEAEVRERSRVEVRLPRSQYQQFEGDVLVTPPDGHGPSRSHSQTPVQTPTPVHIRRPLPQPALVSSHVNSLAPPPPAPHGPRPLSRNRTPSPKPKSDAHEQGTDDSSQESDPPPVMPSEKAIGKRRAEPPPEEEDDWPDHTSLLPLDSVNGDDDDNSSPPEVFVYDAAEERKKQMAFQGK